MRSISADIVCVFIGEEFSAIQTFETLEEAYAWRGSKALYFQDVIIKRNENYRELTIEGTKVVDYHPSDYGTNVYRSEKTANHTKIRKYFFDNVPEEQIEYVEVEVEKEEKKGFFGTGEAVMTKQKHIVNKPYFVIKNKVEYIITRRYQLYVNL